MRNALFSKFLLLPLAAVAITFTSCQKESVSPELQPKARSISSDIQSDLPLYFRNIGGQSFVTATYGPTVEVVWGQDRTVLYSDAYPVASPVTVTLYKPAVRVVGPTRDQSYVIPSVTYTINDARPSYFSDFQPIVPNAFYNNLFTLDLTGYGVESGQYRVTVTAAANQSLVAAVRSSSEEPYLKAVGSLTVY